MWWHSKYHAEKKKILVAAFMKQTKKKNFQFEAFLALFPSTTPHSDPKGQGILVCAIVF